MAVILAGLLWLAGPAPKSCNTLPAPVVGGMVTAPLLSLFVIPAVFLLLRRPTAKQVFPQP